MNYTLLAIILLLETEIPSEATYVGVYIDEHLQFNHINMEVRPNIETMWFEFITTKSKKILFSSLYRQPNFDASVFSQEVESILVNYSKDENETILLADFNFDFWIIN